MLINEKNKLEDFLLKIVEALDIPDDIYEDATLKYDDIGSWLAMDDSDLRDYSPEIYPQGSFRLGTVVNPIFKDHEYDIDLVCHLKIDKDRITQKNLKQMVGDRLKKRDDLRDILTSSRRCWILDFPSEAQMPNFHMDVLPSIPNNERPPTGILLTDRELAQWQKSNPRAYTEWFYDRMKMMFTQRLNELAKSIQAASVEEVPYWRVKTPLQRVVQIFKRHRDIYFKDAQDNKPVSVIITTLAARAYNNQQSIYDALTQIIQTIETNWGKQNFVENRNGEWWVVNPVDSDENFADKWNEYPVRREAFIQWLKKIRIDFIEVSKKQTFEEAVALLESVLGEQTMIKVANDFGLKRQASLPAVIRPQVPALGDTGHCQLPAWAVQECYKAKVTGAVCLKKGGKKLWELTDRSVPKNVWLKFVVTTNTPQPYAIKWQVVNTGKEAAEVRQLRGDFYDSDVPSSSLRWESTLYKGTHWVEAFVIKNGICVARSGHKIVKVR